MLVTLFFFTSFVTLTHGLTSWHTCTLAYTQYGGTTAQIFRFHLLIQLHFFTPILCIKMHFCTYIYIYVFLYLLIITFINFIFVKCFYVLLCLYIFYILCFYIYIMCIMHETFRMLVQFMYLRMHQCQMRYWTMGYMLQLSANYDCSVCPIPNYGRTRFQLLFALIQKNGVITDVKNTIEE